MKRLLGIFTAFVLVVNCSVVWASPPGFSGGVNNEYEYEEYEFITGEPVKLIGKVDISESDKQTQKTVTYKYKLTSEDTTVGMKLDRTITLQTNYTKKNDKGQTIGDTKLTKYSEIIQKGKDKYQLVDFQFSKSDVIDNPPAASFYLGDIKGRKYYTINKDQGNVIVDMTGKNIGYQNFWGNTETQTLEYVIAVDKKGSQTGSSASTNATTSGAISLGESAWQGILRIQTSDSTTKELQFSENEANLSSFNGGYIRVTNRQIVSQYDYDLPRMNNGLADKAKRVGDTLKLNQTYVPKVERLVVPKFRDTAGHWGQGYIEKLYSLDVFNESPQFFSPELPMTRLEFTKGVIKAADMRASMDTKKKTVTPKRNAPKEQSLFKDLKTDDADYQYIKEGVQKNIIQGVSKDIFDPEASLTRAQAVTILIRALGFESKAPNPGYTTAFSDDGKIPYWAKDSIYMAAELGLLQGDNYNNANPDKKMTRAEASALLVRFLEFLQKDLQKDYRENIMNYN